MLFGITPTLHLHASAAAEPGPAVMDYHPLGADQFAFEYIWDFTSASSLTKSGDEIVAVANTGSAGSDGDMAPFSSGNGDIGPEVKSAEAASGYLPGVSFYQDSSGIRSLHVDFDSDITVRSAVCVWEINHDLGTTPTTNSPFGIGNQDGSVDMAMIKWSNTTGNNYNWQGGSWRSTNVPIGDSSDDFRGLRIMVLSWPGSGSRRIACWDSNTSTTYSSFNSTPKDVDRIIAGMRSQHSNGGSCRSLRGSMWLLGVTSKSLTQSEVNSLGRSLCWMFSGNAAAQAASASLPLVWDDTDIDFSTSHASLSHEPFLYGDFQTASTVTTSTDEEAFTCDTDDEIEVASDNTISAGDHVTLSTTGTLPTGLSPGNYFVRSRNSTTLTLVSDYDDVWDATAALSISSGTGTGVHTLSRSLIESISCDHNAVRHFDASGTKATYIASSGAQPGRFVGNAASNGSYVWTNASEQNDGSIMIVARKYGSGSNSGRAASVGSQSAGDQWIEFGGVAGRARSRYAGSIVTCGTSSNPSYTDGEIFVAYFVADSSSGHRLRIFDADTGVWTESSLDSSSIGEKFYERWQNISIETGSKMEIL